jgi:hypothetical protein
MKRGELVRVRVFGGETIDRRVVADKGNYVVVCNEEEYSASIKENREPDGIGFPKEEVSESN